jgi:divinyl chlorophyllide a 8-vinyl-reductase
MLVATMVIALAGATGTIGKATLKRLIQLGYTVRPLSRQELASSQACSQALGLEAQKASGPVKAVISCMASRTGQAEDAWAVDYQANANLLLAAKEHQASKFVLLSAICVQKPQLAFQHAKLKFEEELQASGLDYSIVRPTAFFKSLSGQLARVKKGGPFYVFGDGRLTYCKPISDDDLAEFLVDCLNQPERSNATLLVGGPGPALCPMDQAAMMQALLSRPVKVRHVPIGLLKAVITTLSLLGRFHSGLAKKADYARIGLYYATESMLTWDAKTQNYREDLTPSIGSQRLIDHYRKVLLEDPA